MRPGKKELLDNPFSLQLFNCTPQDWSMCIFSQLFVQPHSEPRDKTAKVQQKLGPAENALAVRTCISHPLEFCHTAQTLTYTSSLAQAKQLYFTKCQNKSLSPIPPVFLAAFQLHTMHCGSVPSFSHICAITFYTLPHPFQISGSCSHKEGSRQESQCCLVPYPYHMRAKTLFFALCSYIFSILCHSIFQISWSKRNWFHRGLGQEYMPTWVTVINFLPYD